MMVRALIWSFFVLILFSCKKSEDRACWKSTGEETSIEIKLDAFSKVFLHEHIEYVLVQDSVEKIVITGGKNLVNFIKVDFVDGFLDVKNENKCFFLRSYKKNIRAEIHFKQINEIIFEGTEPLTNQGLIEFNWLNILIRDGAGSVKLNFNSESIFATISHGWGDFTFTGHTKRANFNLRSNGFCDTYGLTVADSLTVVSNTQGITKINANGVKLKAQIDTGGDIYYKGTPFSVKLNQYGEGQLIDAN
jgi:hypothetical protein